MPPLKSLFAILALVEALSATAAPAGNGVEAGTISMPRQGVARVWACSDIDWKGDCRRFENLLGQCYNVPSEWNDDISSIKNERKGQTSCVWWQHSNCEGLSYDNQEDANLADGNGQWNDRISSWRCR